MIQVLACFALSAWWVLLVRCKRLRKALHVSEARFLAFMDNAPAVASLKDQKGRYVYANVGLQRLFRASLAEIRGTTAADWLTAEVAQDVQTIENEALANGSSSGIAEDVPAPHGDVHSWLVMKFPFREESGRLLCGSVAVDITEQVSLKRQLAEQLRLAEHLNNELAEANALLIQQATTDGLTGLMNSRHFHTVLASQFAFSRRQGSSLSLVMVDVDRFKQFNDTFGHQEGDEALISVARSLRANARDYDLVGRLGGEEFAIILPDTDRDAALLVSERLRESIEKAKWPLRRITVSVGVTTMDGETRNSRELLEQADKALYQAKRRGRNSVVQAGDRATQSVLSSCQSVGWK